MAGPKKIVARIRDAQRRLEAAQKDKIKVRVKEGSKPVYRKEPRIAKPVATPKAATLTHYDDGLSINEMLRETPPRVKIAMQRDNVTIASMRKARNGTTILCETVSYKAKEQTTYRQAVENLDDDTEKFSKSKWVKVRCTCPAFKFWSDWVLHQQGSSDLKYSIDQAPNFTNPRELNMVCKHLLKIFLTLKQTNR